jgi:staphylococcal nuclease domain-containing protein 1
MLWSTQGNARKGQPDEPWANESKEFMRSRLVGRHVFVHVDYEREIPVGDKKEKRTFASLLTGKGQKKKSVGEMLVEEGFAAVSGVARDDTLDPH